MALKGDTSNLLLADIFQTLFQNGQSGILYLRSARIERQVAFAKYGVTLIDAEAFRARRLGHLLVAGGLVPQPIVDAAIGPLDPADPFSSIKLLVVLDEDKHLELARGVAVLRSEVREELFEVFTLEKMEFEFAENDVPIESVPRECYFRPEEVVMEAARRVDEWSRIRALVGQGERYYVVAPGTEVAGAEAVVERLDGTRTTLDISEELLVSRFEVARLVWQLLEANKLRPATVAELLDAARRIDPKVARTRIEKLLRRVAEMLDDSDERLDDAAEIAIRAHIRNIAVDLLVRRARALFNAGHPEAAHTEARRARELKADHRGCLELLVEIHHARGERDAEVKILTVLAENAAADKRFDAAIESSARVAALHPDSPLLDHAFVIWCQNANRADFGAEVLSQAASLLDNPLRVAQLYRAILTLDPLRADVRKMLARLETKKRRGLAVVLGVSLLSLPLLGFGAFHLYAGFARERVRGRIEAAEKMIAAGEWKAAKATLDALTSGELDDEAGQDVERLTRSATVKLDEIAAENRTKTISDTRGLLNAVQTAIDGNRYADAIEKLVEIEEADDDAARNELVTAKRKVLVHEFGQLVARLESESRTFTAPDENTDLKSVLDRFAADFSDERAKDLERVGELARSMPESTQWKDFAASLSDAASRGRVAVEKVLPGLAEIEDRMRRNRELDLLSDDYKQVLDAEKSGDFETAAAGWARLQREYGDGSLATYFSKRRAAADTVRSAIAEIRELSKGGDATAAHARAKALVDSTTDFALAQSIGLPRRIESLPGDAEVMIDGKPIGRTPLVHWVKQGSESRITLHSAGFVDRELAIDFDGPALLRADLDRESRFATSIEAKIDVAPAVTDRFVFLGARDGVLYRLERKDGSRAGEFRSRSLAGACAAPLFAGGTILLPLGEGAIACVDADTMRERWTAPLDSRIVGAPLIDGERLLCATERGALIEVGLKDGATRPLATVDVALRSGPARIGDSIALGAVTGEVIAIDSKDGSTLFRSPKAPQPIIGLLAAGGTFVAADDAGVLTTYDAKTGAAGWRKETGAAAAAAPMLQDGLVLFAAGQRALVIEASSGDVRFEFAADDWISGTPALGGGRLYVADRSGSLVAIDMSNSARVFRHALRSPASPQPLILPEGVLVVTNGGLATIVGS